MSPLDILYVRLKQRPNHHIYHYYRMLCCAMNPCDAASKTIDHFNLQLCHPQEQKPLTLEA